jgi:hypothetical protein
MPPLFTRLKQIKTLTVLIGLARAREDDIASC